MNELKPCPFCGGEANFFAKAFSERGASKCWQFGIFCTGCKVVFPRADYKIELTFGADGEIKVTADERKIAAEAWNRRTNDE